MTADDLADLNVPAEATVRYTAAPMTQAVIVLAPDMQIRYVNAPAAQLIGLSEANAIARNLKDTAANVLAVEIASRAQDLLSTGQDTIFEVQFSGRTWLVHIVPLRDVAGVPRTFSIFCHDVSHIHAHAQEQLAAQRQLTELLVKEVRHRVKNHLQAIIGLLRHHQANNANSDRTIDAAISQLLTMSAVYGLKSRMSDDSIYLDSIISEIVNAARPYYSVREISTPSIDRKAKIDEQYSVPIALVINELVTNAFKHTQQTANARVDIELEFDPHYTRVKIFNAPASLNTTGYMSQEIHGAGLNLARAFLPIGLASLSLKNERDGVLAELTLMHPVVTT